MSSLDLKVEPPLSTLEGKLFPILRDFLQPDNTLTVDSTAVKVLALLPAADPHSTDIWSFGRLCIELAEQIPYHHPSQLKLSALFESLSRSTQLGTIVTDKVKPSGISSFWTLIFNHHSKDAKAGRFFSYQRFGEALRDNLGYPDPEDASQREFVNFHAFAANLDERRIFKTDPTWAIWAQRDAHEGDERAQRHIHGDGEEAPRWIRDAYMLAAAQWILWYGQSFFKQVIYPGDITSEDLQHWTPGPLYDGKAHLTLHRWHFWRDSFKAVASGRRAEEDEKGFGQDEDGFGQECRMVSAAAADLMDSFERNMTF